MPDLATLVHPSGRVVAAAGRPLPALLVTGELLSRERLPKDVAVLPKPYHLELLRAAVIAALGRHAALRAA